MLIETFRNRENPTSQIESFANSLTDQGEKDLILAFLQNPIITAKIAQTPDYIQSAKTLQEEKQIAGEIAGWAFEWLSFTYLNQHTKHTLFSPQDMSSLYQKLYPAREYNDFFFQGKLPVNIRVPDMMEIRNAKNTLQIMKIIEAKAGRLSKNGIIQVSNLYGNLRLETESWRSSLGQAMHEVKSDLEEKPVVFSPNCKIILAVPSNSNFFQPKCTLTNIPISSDTLRGLEQAITSGSI